MHKLLLLYKKWPTCFDPKGSSSELYTNRIPTIAGKSIEYFSSVYVCSECKCQNVCVVELKLHVLFSAVRGGWRTGHVIFTPLHIHFDTCPHCIRIQWEVFYTLASNCWVFYSFRALMMTA
jgi:hypothetical protein